ncbi:helix-turn-helix domain-containing protein [Nonomuraea typhae]|uniref:Helix-turn-helix domain-containing protein n=1 Tax=Nonomuraea typhae TaxID=2603600 RepID=A0ABW7YJT3_9ACTN
MSVVINNEVWALAPEHLSTSARFVLIRMADSALTESRMTCLGVDRIVRETGVSRSSVFRALRELHGKGLIQNVDESGIPATYKAFPTITRRITEPGCWRAGEPLPDYVGPVVLPEPEELDEFIVKPPSDQANEGTDQEGGVMVTPYTSPSRKRRTSSFSAAPSARRANPSRAEARRKAAQAEDELDPAKVFADEPETPAQPESRRDRRAPGPDTGMGLARYFADAVSRSGSWRAPDLVNQTKLASSLNRWRRQGITADQIRAMVDLYAEVDGLRNPRAVPWVDFLNKRALLADKLRHEFDREPGASHDEQSTSTGPGYEPHPIFG